LAVENPGAKRCSTIRSSRHEAGLLVVPGGKSRKVKASTGLHHDASGAEQSMARADLFFLILSMTVAIRRRSF
jgi:hypothetical protein